MQLLMGADPEVFVCSNKGVISAYNMVPGTKQHPHPVPKGAVQVDGMALEYNIDPAAEEEMFVDNITSVLQTLQQMIPKNCTLDISPVAFFDADYLQEQPIEARLLGCEADFNAYTGEKNTSPDENTNMRTAAGHVHLGWTQAAECEQDTPHFEDCRTIVKQLDFALGLLGVIYDPDVERQKMYGQPGAFRPKPYGVEYRVLSNWWIAKEDFIRKVYKNTKKAYNDAILGVLYETSYAQTAKDILSHRDPKEAQRLLKELELSA